MTERSNELAELIGYVDQLNAEGIAFINNILKYSCKYSEYNRYASDEDIEKCKEDKKNRERKQAEEEAERQQAKEKAEREYIALINNSKALKKVGAMDIDDILPDGIASKDFAELEKVAGYGIDPQCNNINFYLLGKIYGRKEAGKHR